MLLLIRNNTLLICAVIFIHFNPSSCQRGLSCPQRGIDCYGEDIEFIPNEARVWMECAELCDYHKSCAYWTFHTDELRCDFKWACSDKRMNANRISGHYSCDRSTSTTPTTTLVTLPTCPPCAAPTRVVIPTCPPCDAPIPVVIPTCPPCAAPAPVVIPTCAPAAAPTPVVIPTCPPCADPTPVVIPICPPAAAPTPVVIPTCPPCAAPAPVVIPSIINNINSINFECPMETTFCMGEVIKTYESILSWEQCGQLCSLESSCAFWTFRWITNQCQLKHGCEKIIAGVSSSISGYHTCSGGMSSSDDRLVESTIPTCTPIAASTSVVILTCPSNDDPDPIVIPTCPSVVAPAPIAMPTCPPCADPTPVAAQVDCPDCDEEVKKIQDQYKEHIDKVTKMNGGFFLAAVHSDPSWNIPLDYIPEFTDIEKTTANFLRNSTVGTIMYGNSRANDAKVKLYQNSADKRFVRVEDEDGEEYIHAYDQDKNLLKDGIFRFSWPDGETMLGNRIFRRDGRKEDRMYRLYRYSNGNIDYDDQIMEEGSNEFKFLSEYRFNPDTFTWTKTI